MERGVGAQASRDAPLSQPHHRSLLPDHNIRRKRTRLAPPAMRMSATSADVALTRFHRSDLPSLGTTDRVRLAPVRAVSPLKQAHALLWLAGAVGHSKAMPATARLCFGHWRHRLHSTLPASSSGGTIKDVAPSRTPEHIASSAHTRITLRKASFMLGMRQVEQELDTRAHTCTFWRRGGEWLECGRSLAPSAT